MDRNSINVLSLCAGAGGLDLGVRMALPTARTVCYVEIEAYACEVLASRMEEGRLDSAPIWTDLRTFDGAPWRGLVDLVVGGYPCQPFSAAGKRLGADDPRHLWPHVARIIRELGPAACFFENVSGHVSLGLRDVRCELEGMGYRVEAEIVRAEEVGAPHRRERIFVLAHAIDGERSAGCGIESRRRIARSGFNSGAMGNAGSLESDLPTRARENLSASSFAGGAMGDAPRGRVPDNGIAWGGDAQVSVAGSASGDLGQWPPGPEDREGWRNWPGPQPAVRRDADGLANRVDRLRLCGNGVVRRQAAYAFRCLMERLRVGE